MLKPATPDKEGTNYFRATFDLKDADASAIEEEHDAYIKKLLDEKKLRTSGSYVNNPKAGLSILSVADAAEAEAIMKADPFVEKLGAEYQVIQWNPRCGDFK